MLTIDQRDTTLQCLSSLLAQREPPFHVLLWDNGSQDGTAEAVREAFPEVLVHYHPGNLGVASGRNAAAQLAITTFYPSHLLFLDNDLLFEPGFVRALLQPFTEDDGGGAQINFLLWQINPVGYGQVDRGQPDNVKKYISCGGAMIVRNDLFLQLGRFDTAYDPFGPEDLDFSLRLQKAGYSTLYVPQAVAYHVVSHTFGQGYSENYVRHKSRHWLIFMRRHASLGQQMGIFLLGAPYLALQVMMREGRRGNIEALRGLVRGLLDVVRPALPAG